MESVRQLLESKGREVWSISPDATVYDAVKMMAEKQVGALAVTQGEELVGVFSERDYARKVTLEGRSSRDTTVGDIMTRRVCYAQLDQQVDECMAIMTEKRVRHMPVMEGDRLVGMISVGDLVKSVISEQKFVIEQLENYIHG